MTSRKLALFFWFLMICFSCSANAEMGSIDIRFSLVFPKPSGDRRDSITEYRARERALRKEIFSEQTSTRTVLEILEELAEHLSKFFGAVPESKEEETDQYGLFSEKRLPLGIAFPRMNMAPPPENETQPSNEPPPFLEFPSGSAYLTSPVSEVPSLGRLTPQARGIHMSHMPIPPHIVVDELGQGGIGVVQLVKGTDGRLFALKTLDLRYLTHRRRGSADQDHVQHESAKLLVEPKILGALSGHPNIVGLIGSEQDDTHLRIAMEYIPGTSLARVQLNEPTARIVMQQLLHALHFCHLNGIAHLDIKPDNVIWDSDDEKITLIDFGEARFFTPGNPIVESHLSLGTLGFRRIGTDNVIQHDLYALGRTCAHILAKSMSAQAANFIDVCMLGTPIEDLLAHPWISDVNDT